MMTSWQSTSATAFPAIHGPYSCLFGRQKSQSSRLGLQAAGNGSLFVTRPVSPFGIRPDQLSTDGRTSVLLYIGASQIATL